MSSKKFTKWVDKKDYKTCLRIAQTYYSLKDQGLKVNFFKHSLPGLFAKRLFFVFIGLFRFNRNPYKQYFASASIRDFVKRLLGLYKFEAGGLLPVKPDLKPLTFTDEPDPEVSIIIAVHNHFNFTYNCLHALLLHTKDVKYEIILINDCSSDQTAQYIKQIKNIVYLENEENLGFLRSCNKAAKVARGSYLCFLNNDTQVRPGWLGHMRAVFNTDSNTGLVGAKLIFPNGLLQEAGGLVDFNGDPANYGRYDDPDQTRYNYLRETDYCSGACILLSSASFEQLKGFDERYIPAYYEDTDLCMAVRHQLGKKVYFQPLAEVIHFEGISSGKTLKQGNVKTYQSTNAIKFKDKWKDTLRNFPAQLSDEEIADKYRHHKTILFIDAALPTYDKDSGSRRMFELLKIFKSLNFNLAFLAHDAQRPAPYFEELTTMGVQILRPVPFSNQNILADHDYLLGKVNTAWICRPSINEIYLPFIRNKKAVFWVYDTVDLHFIREERQMKLENNVTPEEVERIQAVMEQEVGLSREANLTIAITKTEADILIDKGAKNVKVIPNIHEPHMGSPKSFGKREGICFIGGYYHSPNIDAVLWLIHEIMPLVWQTDPDIKVTIMGSNPTPELISLQGSKVEVTGYIEDVTDYFTSSRVFVAPLRYGAGMKGKIGQSLEFNLPVITTDIGAEGMGLRHGHDVLIANSTEEFAKEILNLYHNEILWNQVSSNSLTAIEKYSPLHIAVQLQEIFGSGQ